MHYNYIFLMMRSNSNNTVLEAQESQVTEIVQRSYERWNSEVWKVKPMKACFCYWQQNAIHKSEFKVSHLKISTYWLKLLSKPKLWDNNLKNWNSKYLFNAAWKINKKINKNEKIQWQKKASIEAKMH